MSNRMKLLADILNSGTMYIPAISVNGSFRDRLHMIPLKRCLLINRNLQVIDEIQIYAGKTGKEERGLINYDLVDVYFQIDCIRINRKINEGIDGYSSNFLIEGVRTQEEIDEAYKLVKTQEVTARVTT